MKIDGPGKTQQTSQTQRKGKTSGAGGAFGDFMTDGTSESSAAATTHSIAHIDTLLAVQEADDPAQRAARKRMTERADTLLDELEKMRLGLLTGSLTIGHVIDIADVVAAHREKIMDPRLTAILDEIDMRAQIEMAKIRMSMDARKAAGPL